MTGDGRWNWGVGGVSRVSTPSQIHMHMLKGERRGGQKEGREEHGRCHHNKNKRWAINMSSNQSSYEPSTCDCEKYVTKLQSKAEVNQGEGIYTDHLTLLCFVISTLSYSDHLHVFTHPLSFHFGKSTEKYYSSWNCIWRCQQSWLYLTWNKHTTAIFL